MTAILAKNSTFDRRRHQPHEIERLYAALHAVTPETHPRTARLLGSSSRKVAQKVIEEAGEVALAAVKHNSRNIVRESADLLYQLAVLWHREGILPDTVWAEMRRRAETMGIAEKLPKPPKPLSRSTARPKSKTPKAGRASLDRELQPRIMNRSARFHSSFVVMKRSVATAFGWAPDSYGGWPDAATIDYNIHTPPNH